MNDFHMKITQFMVVTIKSLYSNVANYKVDNVDTTSVIITISLGSYTVMLTHQNGK